MNVKLSSAWRHRTCITLDNLLFARARLDSRDDKRRKTSLRSCVVCYQGGSPEIVDWLKLMIHEGLWVITAVHSPIKEPCRVCSNVLSLRACHDETKNCLMRCYQLRFLKVNNPIQLVFFSNMEPSRRVIFHYSDESMISKLLNFRFQ